MGSKCTMRCHKVTDFVTCDERSKVTLLYISWLLVAFAIAVSRFSQEFDRKQTPKNIDVEDDCPNTFVPIMKKGLENTNYGNARPIGLSSAAVNG